MATLDTDKYLAGLDSEMKSKAAHRAHAVESGWFDKAARLDAEIEGLRKARFLAKTGLYDSDKL